MRLYRAIAGERPRASGLLDALRASVGYVDDGYVLELGATVLRTLASGGRWPASAQAALAPVAAVDAPLLGRLLAEAWLGGPLFEAVHGEPPRIPDLAGTIQDARPEPRVVAALAAARTERRPSALVTELSPPEALFLLGAHGLTDAADQIVASGPGAPTRTPAERVAEACQRLGVPRAVVVYEPTALPLVDRAGPP
ncbi:MAG: hypothetical protein H6746_06165 [Deltaproteobacteria bacterium]|nr:hypothetical protein [Deltaproteobacteria bacterium]